MVKIPLLCEGVATLSSGLFLAATQLKDETEGGSESRVVFSV